MNSCECGCGQLVKSRFAFNHHGRKSGNDYLIQDMGYETPCWVWQLSLNKWGYGKTKKDGKTVAAHRVSYENTIGPIPEGKDLDHLCRIRKCVNPYHLEPVDPITNKRRGNVAKLDEKDIREIIYLSNNGIPQHIIANEYNIGQVQVSRIVRGLRWTNVVGDNARAAYIGGTRSFRDSMPER